MRTGTFFFHELSSAYTPSFLPGGGGGACWSTVYRWVNKGPQKLTLNSLFDILKLILLFAVASQKLTLSNVLNYNAFSLDSATFCTICKKTHTLFLQKNCIFPTLNDNSAAHCPARKKYPFSSFFFSRFGTQLTRKRPRAFLTHTKPKVRE